MYILARSAAKRHDVVGIVGVAGCQHVGELSVEFFSA
jgi:hypothetical protein